MFMLSALIIYDSCNLPNVSELGITFQVVSQDISQPALLHVHISLPMLQVLSTSLV